MRIIESKIIFDTDRCSNCKAIALQKVHKNAKAKFLEKTYEL